MSKDGEPRSFPPSIHMCGYSRREILANFLAETSGKNTCRVRCVCGNPTMDVGRSTPLLPFSKMRYESGGGGR
jgi:hypothetical protein